MCGIIILPRWTGNSAEDRDFICVIESAERRSCTVTTKTGKALIDIRKNLGCMIAYRRSEAATSIRPF